VVNSNDAEAAIVIRAVNEASEELETLQEDVDDTSESLFGFSRNAVATGIAALGLSFGLNEALDAAGKAQDIDAQTDAILRLLGPEVQKAFDDLTPLFDDVGNSVGALERDVKRAALVITQNTAGIVPDIDELAFAFDLAAATGADLDTAAAAVGQAMQGNVAPLNALLDPSGRSYVSLDAAMEDLVGTSAEAESGFDKLQRRMGEAIEEVGSFIDELLEVAQKETEFDFSFFTDFFTDTIPQVFNDAISFIADAAGNMWDGFKENFVDPITDFFKNVIPDLWQGFLDLIPDLNILGLNIGNNSGGDGGGSGFTVIVNGNVESRETAAELARQVNRSLRETNRRGVNVSA